MEKVVFKDLGRIEYQECWDYQTKLKQELVESKAGSKGVENADPQIHKLLFCEHPHTYTLGKSGSKDHLLIRENELTQQEIQYVEINRGGDITYHGPGQLVGYPIFDLDCFFNDLHKYVRYLEEAVIRLLKTYDLEAIRVEGKSGVWLPPTKDNQPYRKIMAVGIHMSRWVTMHGFALNVNSDLSFFNQIVPCGIAEPDKSVTTLALELGAPVDMEDLKLRLKGIYASLFGYEYL